MSEPIHITSKKQLLELFGRPFESSIPSDVLFDALNPPGIIEMVRVEETPIKGFFGQHRWLSNFWPCQVDMDGRLYPSVEHAYQAAKTDDVVIRQFIRNAPSAKEAKQLGKALKVRPLWEDIRLQVMEDLLRQKFTHDELKEQLLATGTCLIEETNSWGDVFWGVCKGEGENNLGKLIMQIRTEFQQQE